MKNSKEKFEDMHELHIPEGTEYIDEQFCDQIELDANFDTNIEKLYIPKTVCKIDCDFIQSKFDCLQSFFVDDDNLYFKDVDGVLYNKQMTKLLCCPMGYNQSVTIPETITEITPYAFHNCQFVNKIMIPNSVRTIGEYAFHACRSLERIVLPSKLEIIPRHLFYKCAAREIVIPDSVCEIHEEAFCCLGKLEHIFVQKNNRKYYDIDGTLFDIDGSLLCYPAGKKDSNYTVPESVKQIAAHAFEYCRTLKELALPASVEQIDYSAFYKCDALESISVHPDNLQYCDVDGVLFDQSRTALIRYPEGRGGNYIVPASVKELKDNAFSGCQTLQSVTLHNSIKQVGHHTFTLCRDLKNMILPESLCDISNQMFSECHNLRKVVIPDSIKKIGKEAFYNCRALKKIEIPNSVEKIETGAFWGCCSLESAVLPENLDCISDGLFFDCNLKKITIPNGVKTIGKLGFCGCGLLAHVEFPDSVKLIDECAFEFCGNLESISLPEGLLSIPDFAFCQCEKLRDITIPGSVQEIGWCVFGDQEYDKGDMVSNIQNLTIHAPRGSYAEKYAKKENIRFEALE